MKKIVPCLWFDGVAEEAAGFYASIFRNSGLNRVNRFGKEGQEIHGRPEGSVMTVEFDIDGCRLLGLNGGPRFKFTPATSLFVTLETEAEVDAAWAALVEGGTVLMPLQAYDWSQRYGWLQDRYGVSWQIYLGRRADVRQAVVPSLMFVGEQHGRGEEAITLYTSVFANSRVDGIHRYDGSGADPEDSIKHAQFQLCGETFMLMESALEHQFGFNESISFIVYCESQEQIDHYWNALSAVPEAERCGWLKDRFGVSWQIVPTMLPELLEDPGSDAGARVMNALMNMNKLDVGALRRAYEG